MKTLKNLLTITAAIALAGNAAKADFSQTFSGPFAGGGAIPDGSFIGFSDTQVLTGLPFDSITDVNVHLNIAGGWNGDLYAYLFHDANFAVLLNRVGRTSSSSFGYGDAGMSVVLDDQAVLVADIHNYQTEPGYNPFMITGGTHWKADGRNINPLSSGATFDATIPTALLSAFNGVDPNGAWTLAIFDVSGGGSSTLTSWGLDIAGITAAVPEPASIIEGALAALLIGGMALFYRVKPFNKPVAA